MTRPGTADCFKAIYQDPVPNRAVGRHSFAEQMMMEAHRVNYARPKR